MMPGSKDKAAGSARPGPAAVVEAGVVVVRVFTDGRISMTGEEPTDGPIVRREDPLLNSAEVAQLLGIGRKTWTSYVARGQAPAADEPDLGRPVNRREPKWRQTTIARYKALRRRPNPRTKEGGDGDE